MLLNKYESESESHIWTQQHLHVIIFHHKPTQMFSFPYLNTRCVLVVLCYQGVYVQETQVKLIRVMGNLTGWSALTRWLWYFWYVWLFDVRFACWVDALMLWYCGKMPSSLSFHPLLSLCNITLIENVIIILFCEAECVIKSKMHFNVLQVHDEKCIGRSCLELSSLCSLAELLSNRHHVFSEDLTSELW